MELTEEYTIVNHPFINNKELRALKFFWIGFIIYTGIYTLSQAYPVNLDRWYLMQTVGLLLCIPAAVSLIQFKIENKYLRVAYILYCAWLSFVILRGFKFDYVQLRSMAFDAWYGIFLYFVPLILLFPKNIFYLKKTFDAISLLSILYIAYCLIFRRVLLGDPDGEDATTRELIEHFTKNLSIPSGFLLLTYMYQPSKRKLLAFFVIILTLILVTIRGRRSLIFMTTCPLIFSYFIFFYLNKRKLSVILLSLVLIGAVGAYGYKLYNANKNGAFSLIADRVDQDTRTGVEDCYYDDMQTKDWIIGRGLNGEYFCPGVDTELSNYRTVIETDYLNIILKGGVISLGLLLLIVIPAMVKGLFYSKNMLSKAAGIWILLWVIDLYPATVNTFTLNYLLVWICVGICYSKTIRNMPESAVKEIFSGQNK